MEPRKPGAFVKTGDRLEPDANDEAMAARMHTGEPKREGKREKAREVTNEHQ